MRDLWNFIFFGGGSVPPSHSETCRFVSGSKAKHQVSFPVIILLEKCFVCLSHRDNMLARCDFLCSGVKDCETKLTHNFYFPESFFRIRRTTVLGMLKILLPFLLRFDGHFFLPNQQQQQCLPHFESILGGHHSRHLLLVPFSLEIENTT
jgi:hypothetical protein